MKHIKTPIAALLAACLLLTGCNAPAESNSPDSTTSTSSSQTQSSSETSSSAPDSSSSDGSHSSVPDNSTPNAETPDYSKFTETEQIFKTIKDCRYICWGMFPFDLNKDLVDLEQEITADYLGREKQFFKVVNGDIKTEAQFMETLDSVFTEKRKKQFLEKPERPFTFKDGDLYIGDRGAGGGGHFNKLIINKIECPDENTVILDLTALGEKEYWGDNEDSTKDFSVTLVKTDKGIRIDECDIEDLMFFSMEIVYNDISFKINDISLN